MKKRAFIIILILFSFLIVNANIICNDGSVSKSCKTCHRGCCSRHGGCSNNVQRSTRNNYTEPKESIQNNNAVEKNNNESKVEEKNSQPKQENTKIININSNSKSTNTTKDKKEKINPLASFLVLLGGIFGVRALIKRK